MANLFAVVLARVLSAHQFDERPMTINDLDSVTTYGNDHIHRETVRRLQRSLKYPSYPTLSEENLARVVKIVGLNQSERLILVAAILATKIQAELDQRIDARHAYLAAEKVLPIIREGLAELEDDEGFDIRVGDNSVVETSAFDDLYAGALAAIDWGLIILTSAHYVTDMVEKRAVAQMAYETFTQALISLEQQREDSGTWRFWHEEAKHGQEEAQSYQ